MTDKQLKWAEKPLDVFYPSKQTQCTKPFSQFLRDYHSHLDLFFFVVQLVTHADHSRVKASKVLAPLETRSEERARLEASAADPNVTLRVLQKHSGVLSRNLTNGMVNAFQRYFSAIVQAVAEKRPVVMTSGQTVKVDDVLRFTRHRDLVAFIIDRKINDLSYGGLAEMEKYFNERLGVQMFQSERERDVMRVFIEARNINAHNGGVVNELFLSRVGKVKGFKFTEGKPFHVDMDALVELSENAMRVAMEIDATVSAKFGLRRKAHGRWLDGTREAGQQTSVAEAVASRPPQAPSSPSPGPAPHSPVG